MTRHITIGITLALALAGTTHAQTVRYVDANSPSNGPGNDWQHAHHHLQDALSVVVAGDEVRVAQGTHRPDETTASPGGTGSRLATFQLISGVAIKGGYRGLAGGGDPDERGFESILSGDIGIEGDDADNSYHVVTGSGTDATAILEGFTITGGTANGLDPLDRGAGMYNNAGSPTVLRCTFIDNTANFGGGMCNDGRESRADASPTVIHCVFSGNSASGGSVGYGGGMCNLLANPTVRGCAFIGNSAEGIGAFGGGIANEDNTAAVTNCLFRGNAAISSWVGCGGGMHSDHDGTATLINCTFSGNSAALGGGLAVEGATVTVTNCILWGDTPDEVYDGGLTCAITYSAVQDDMPGDNTVYPGDGNIDDDPLLRAAADVHLTTGSPCVNAGSGEGFELPETDLDGHARILCGAVDMGAYEFGIGDSDCDGDVDVDDFTEWPGCATGPGSSLYDDACQAFDFEFDSDVDLDDFAAFARSFSGPL